MQTLVRVRKVNLEMLSIADFKILTNHASSLPPAPLCGRSGGSLRFSEVPPLLTLIEKSHGPPQLMSEGPELWPPPQPSGSAAVKRLIPGGNMA